MTNKEQIAEQTKIEIESITDPLEQLNIIHEATKKIDAEFTEISQEFKKEIHELSKLLESIIKGNDYFRGGSIYALIYSEQGIKSGYKINDPAAERTGYSVQTSRTVWLLE